MSDEDRQRRMLPNIKFTATLRGVIVHEGDTPPRCTCCCSCGWPLPCPTKGDHR